MRFALCVLLAAVMAACIGSFEEKNPGQGTGGPDAGPIACDEPAQAGNGKHNAGQPCLDCHSDGGGAPVFTIGGTLYDDVSGTAPVAGATVHVVDADGNDITMVTADNGNFWTTAAVAFPVTTYASLCPDNASMASPVDQAGGNCNTAGCHGDAFRVHVP